MIWSDGSVAISDESADELAAFAAMVGAAPAGGRLHFGGKRAAQAAADHGALFVVSSRGLERIAELAEARNQKAEARSQKSEAGVPS